MSGMARWVRQRGDALAQWHLLPQRWQTPRGMVLARCGLSLGTDPAELERDDQETSIGNRCVACQGIVLRWV
jgi:hypothetical protein